MYYNYDTSKNFKYPFPFLFFRLIVLILIRKSISSMKRHLEKMTDRLPYHFDDDLISNHSATSPNMHGKDTTMDTMVGHHSPDPEVVLWSHFFFLFSILLLIFIIMLFLKFNFFHSKMFCMMLLKCIQKVVSHYQFLKPSSWKNYFFNRKSLKEKFVT